MGKSVHLFATIALALLASVGTLLVLPIGPAQGAATPTEPGFTDSPGRKRLDEPHGHGVCPRRQAVRD